jgi:hypothetical protein
MTLGNMRPPTTAPTEKPNVAPWSGSGLIALDARPFARSLLYWYAFAVLIGYCAIIAWAMARPGVPVGEGRFALVTAPTHGSTVARGINDAGRIVGSYIGDAGGRAHARNQSWKCRLSIL